MNATPTQDPTPEHIAEQATQRVRLPMFAVIGIFGSDARRAALIRAHDGNVHKVTVGDTLEGSKVTAIDIDQVNLAKGTHTKVLRLPTT